jgi:hypothetical protein
MVTDGSGNLSFATIAATPGGSTTQVQYNNAGAFAGSANLIFDGTTLTAAGLAVPSGLTSTTTYANVVATFKSNAAGADTTLQFTDSVAFNSYISAKGGVFRFQPTGNSVSVLTIDGGTAVTSLTGLLDISGSGAGQIKFPATQNASSNANTLDDYEEGTWTPSLGGTATYSAQLGQYIKIGRQVTVTVILQVSTLGTGSTTTISGLPFATNATAISGNAVAKFTTAVNVIGLNALALDGSVTTIRFTYISASGTTNTYDPALFGNSTAVYFSLTYFVN